MSDFKIGDVVKLKSGGPRMTITRDLPASLAGASVECTWFEANGKVASEEFPLGAVALTEPEGGASLTGI